MSANEERLLAPGSSAIRGHQETFSQLTNVDMKFGFVRDGSGDERELTQSSFSSFLQQRDPEVRRNAFHQFYREFKDHQFTLASALGSSIRGDVFDSRARNYSSAIEAALFAWRRRSVYDNLISTVRNSSRPCIAISNCENVSSDCRSSSLRYLHSDGRRHAEQHRMGRSGGTCARGASLGQEYSLFWVTVCVKADGAIASKTRASAAGPLVMAPTQVRRTS